MGCGEGVANNPDTGVDGDSTAVNRLSILSIMVSTIEISELVICEVGPETSVAGEGDRPTAVDGGGVSERPGLAE